MGWFSGIVVFLLIWWTALFAVLPWGLQRDEDGTPQNPRLKSKIIITTLLSFLLWCMLYILIEMEIISFREMAGQMMNEAGM